MKRAYLVLAIICLSAALATAEAPQVSLSYTQQGSQPTPGKSWFGMNGGRADLSWPILGRWSVVGEFGGVHTGSYGASGSPLTVMTFMAGPRLSLASRRRGEKTRLVPFAQFLFGGAFAPDGLFPQGGTIKTSARSVALSAGGGFDVKVRPALSVRVIQADYLYTHMPDLYDNYQNSYRLGAGIVFRWR